MPPPALAGWGLDFVWPYLLGYPADRLAVIDEVCMYHPNAAKQPCRSLYDAGEWRPLGVVCMHAGGAPAGHRGRGREDVRPRAAAPRAEHAGPCARPSLPPDVPYDSLTEERLRRANEGLSERVRERTQDLNRVWQNSRDLLVVLDLAGRIRAANPAWH